MTILQRTIFPIFSLCFFIGNMASAQRGRADNSRSVLNPGEQPLVIVDSFTTDFDHLLMNPENIKSVDLLKNNRAASLYGEKARHGVIIVRPKKHTKIVQLTQLLDRFNIPEQDRNLNVCIDRILVRDAKKLVVDNSDILSVEVVNDICWVSPDIPGPEERHINIVRKRIKKAGF